MTAAPPPHIPSPPHPLKHLLRYLIPRPLYKRLSSFPYYFCIYILSLIFLCVLVLALWHTYGGVMEWDEACRPVREYYWMTGDAIEQRRDAKRLGFIGAVDALGRMTGVGALGNSLHRFIAASTSNDSPTDSLPVLQNQSLHFGILINQYDSRMVLDLTQASSLSYDLLLTFQVNEEFSTECLILNAENITIHGDILWRIAPEGIEEEKSRLPFPPFSEMEMQQEFQAFQSTFDKAQYKYVKSVNLFDVDAEENELKTQNPSPTKPSNTIPPRYPDAGIVIHFKKRLFTGTYQVYLRVNDMQSDPWLRSFYASSYDSGKKTVALTHLYPTFARRVFPSLDNPNFRSIHYLELWLRDGGTHRSYTFNALSNMRILSDSYATFPQNTPYNSRVIRFLPTPPLATHMTGWIVGQFNYLQRTVNNVKLRLYAPVSSAHLGEYALDVATNATSFFTQFLQIPYPQEKLDLVALPEFQTTSNGAYGLIYLEQDFALGARGNMSLAQEMDIVRSVTWGIAEQWTTNVVTTKVWTNIFTVQSFSLYLEHRAVEILYPDWKIWDEFTATRVHRMMLVDALPKSHSLIDSSLEGFGQTPSVKGALLLRALETVLGEETFRRWVRSLYQHYYFSSIDYVDFLVSIPGGEVFQRQFMTWITQSGHPVVTVKELTDENSDAITPSVTGFSQQRFRTFEEDSQDEDGDVAQHKDEKTKADPSNVPSERHWWIPLKVFLSTGQEYQLDLQAQAFTPLPHEQLLDADWYLLRSEFPVRFNYPVRTWERLIVMIRGNHPWITESDRHQLLDDVWTLALYDNVPLYLAMDMMQSISEVEDSLLLWRTLLNHLNSLSRLTNQLPVHPYIRQFCRNLLAKKVRNLGFTEEEDESYGRKRLRVFVLEASSYFGDEDIVQEGLSLFEELMQNSHTSATNSSSPIHSPSLIPVILQNAVRHGTEQAFYTMQRLFEQYSLETKKHAAYAMAQTRTPSLIRTALEYTLSRDVQQQHGVFIMRSIAANPYGIGLAWDFFRTHWDKIVEKFGRDQTSALLPFFAESFATNLRHEEMTLFEGRLSSRQIGIAKQVIRQNQKFMRSKYGELDEWVRGRVQANE